MNEDCKYFSVGIYSFTWVLIFDDLIIVINFFGRILNKVDLSEKDR